MGIYGAGGGWPKEAGFVLGPGLIRDPHPVNTYIGLYAYMYTEVCPYNGLCNIFLLCIKRKLNSNSIYKFRIKI